MYLAYGLMSRHGHTEVVPFADGEWQAGWIALKYRGQPATAYGHFVRLHDGVTSEISKSRGAFWAGEAASELDRPEDARRWYQTAAAYPATLYGQLAGQRMARSEEHTSELQSLMRISYAVFCLKKKKNMKQRVRRPE